MTLVIGEAGDEACKNFMYYLLIFFCKSKNVLRNKFVKKKKNMPWLVWLSGLRTGPWTKGLLVWFPVRAHACVAGQVRSPVGGTWEATTHWCFSPSYPLSKINKQNVLFLKRKKILLAMQSRRKIWPRVRRKIKQ